MKRILTRRALWVFPIFTSFAAAGQREVVSGYVEAIDSRYYDLLFRPDRYGEPIMGLVDGLSNEFSTLPVRARMDVEREGMNLSAGPPVGIALRVLPDEVLWPAGVQFSPERFAGQNSGLHPGLHERNPFEVTSPADYDMDGFPDENDLFPGDPAESADNDGDGTGDNGDTDDDNDAMADAYESENGLDPLTDDAKADPDNDGVNNLEECAAGTGASDPGSFFQIENVTPLLPGIVRLEWQALPGRSYEVWHSPDLKGEEPLLRDPISVSEPATLRVQAPLTGSIDFLFVRVTLNPPP
jgi:hypothetical protein